MWGLSGLQILEDRKHSGSYSTVLAEEETFSQEVYGEKGLPTWFTSCHTHADQELTVCQSAFQVPGERTVREPTKQNSSLA